MAVITCRKCGMTSGYTEQPPVECVGCGAVYAKVEAAAAARDSSLARPSSAAPARAHQPRTKFIDELRANTLYPAFRVVTNVAAWLWYVAAVVVLIGSIVKGGLAVILGGVVLSILVCVLARAVKEASTMFADLSDAAVYTAERQRSAASSHSQLP